MIVGFPQSDVEDKTDGISILAAVADQLIRTLAITALRGLIWQYIPSRTGRITA